MDYNDKLTDDHAASHLTDKQRLAVDCIVQGLTDQQVAKEIGAARETVCRWRNAQPGVRRGVESAADGTVARLSGPNAPEHRVGLGCVGDRAQGWRCPSGARVCKASGQGRAPDWTGDHRRRNRRDGARSGASEPPANQTDPVRRAVALRTGLRAWLIVLAK